MNALQTTSTENELISYVIDLVRSSKNRVAVAVNAELTMLYWQIGHRINLHVLQGERAEYGKEIIAQLSKKLTDEFGKGWSKRNLAQMVKFATAFSDLQILQTLSAKLSWSHFNQLAYIDDPLKREFYATMAA